MVELMPYIVSIVTAILAGGSVAYLYVDKKVRSNGEKAEDKAKENHAKEIGLDFLIKVDDYQTRKLSDIVKDIDTKNQEIIRLEHQVKDLTMQLNEKNEQLDAKNDEIVQLREENKKLQLQILHKNEILIQSKNDVLAAKESEAKVLNMACVRAANKCKRFLPLTGDDDGKDEGDNTVG